MKNIGLLILLGFFVTTSGYSETAANADTTDSNSLEEMLKKAEELHMTGEEEESLELYEKVLQEDESNLEALWNATVLYTKKGFRMDNENEKEEHYEKAKDLAEQALKHHEDEGHAYYAYAVSMARMTELMDSGDKIEASREIKEHIDKAAERLPDFAPAWHLYGVWHSDVANVSGAEKTAAGLFSSGLPDASNEKAEEYLTKAVSMDKDNILFRLDLAKHYIEVDNADKARDQLQKILELDPKMKDDPRYKEEAKKLLDEIG